MKSFHAFTIRCACALILGVAALASGAADLEFEDTLKIDVHSHIFDDMPEFVAMMERVNLRVVNICLYGNQPGVLEPLEQQAEMLYSKYRPQFFFASTFDLTQRDEPDYAARVTQWLDRTFEAGAVMTKLWKEVGMELKTPSGAYLMPDDPLLDPIYEHFVTRGIPLMIHAADPLDAWLPLDPDSVHYKYYSNNPKWHVHGRDEFPSHAAILAAHDRVLERHPKLVVVSAHLAGMAHDLDALAERLDRYPNLYVDVSARRPDLARHPREKVRDFFVQYQDRILYGVDYGSCQFPKPGPIPEETLQAFIKNAEAAYRADFAYFAGNGDRSLNLPRTVVERFYHGNAQRLMPALAE